MDKKTRTAPSRKRITVRDLKRIAKQLEKKGFVERPRPLIFSPEMIEVFTRDEHAKNEFIFNEMRTGGIVRGYEFIIVQTIA